MPDRITIEDLEVRFHVGVPDEERTEPQRLLITIELAHDLGASGTTDSLAETIDYFAVCQAVKALGQTRSWKLIEALADDICMLVLDQFSPSVVRVVVKKFILPDTRWVSVEMIRPAKNRQDSDRCTQATLFTSHPLNAGPPYTHSRRDSSNHTRNATFRAPFKSNVY